MKEMRIIVSYWKKRVDSHGKKQISRIVGAWLQHYLETGINLAK